MRSVVPESVRSFVARLPKVELHVHLEGSLRPAILLRLAEKHGLDQLAHSLDDLEKWYAFSGFPHFLDVYRQAVEALRDEDDFALLAADVARTLAAQNVRHAEVSFSLSDHLKRGLPAELVFAGLECGRREVEREAGISIRWIPDFAGDFGTETGERTLDAVLAAGPPSVLGFSIGGIEVPRGPFRDVFCRARAAGLRSLPHAGETEGPDRVWSAIRDLKAERIGHGIGSMTDPELVDHLREARIPVDVSPTSNVCTRMVERIEEHPLPRMLEAGLLVTLNTDDPPMFGTDLLGEYDAAYRMGLPPETLAELARNGVHASFLGAAERHALLAEIDAVARAEVAEA